MRSASGTPASRPAMPRWIATAHATASTTVANSHQGTVAHELDDAPPVLGDERVDELPAVCLEALERAGLVALHQPAVADHVGRQDGGQPPLDPRCRHGRPPPGGTQPACRPTDAKA